MKRFQSIFVVAIALFAIGATTAVAAHNGNNRAAITGTGDPDATGQAVVNYSEGRGDFNGTITVRNLNPGETYSFYVRRGTVEQLICSGEANDQGVFTCAEQLLPLNGFSAAVVRDSQGVEVATGVFDRRGNCRDPQQAGSQCSAPGQQP